MRLDDTLQATEETINIASNVAGSMQDKGVMLYIAAVFVTLGVIMMTVFLIIFVKKVLPSENLQETITKQTEELSEIMTENYRESLNIVVMQSEKNQEMLIKDIKTAFEGVNQSVLGTYEIIQGLYDLIQGTKKLTEGQCMANLETMREAVSEGFENELIRIVDENNLADNISFIIPEISDYFRNRMKRAVDTLHKAGITQIDFDIYWNKSKKVREEGMLQIIEAISETIDNLKNIEQGIKHVKHEKDKLGIKGIQESYSKKRDVRREDYSELKRILKLIVSRVSSNMFDILIKHLKEQKSQEV